MILYINGQKHEVTNGISLDALLKELQLDTRKIAVERNLAIVPKSQYELTELAEGDRLEIVNFVGGG